MNKIKVAMLVIVGVLGAVACQPSRAPVDQEAFLKQLQSEAVPVTGITVKDNCVVVHMSYDPQADKIDGPTAGSHMKSVITQVCKYAYGYCADVRFTSSLHAPIRWTQMKDFCDGKIAVDNVDYIVTYEP